MTMDLQEVAKDLKLFWEAQPGAVVLAILGFLIFVFLVVDTWRHRRWRKRQRKAGVHRWRP